MTDKEQGERFIATHGLIGAHLGAELQDAYSLIQEIRGLIQPLTDTGTSMDTGAGCGSADMYFTVGGVEYFMEINLPIRKAAP